VYSNPLKEQTFETISSKPPNHALNGYYGDETNISIVLPRHMTGENPESLTWKSVFSVMIKKLGIFLMQLARAGQGIKKRFA